MRATSPETQRSGSADGRSASLSAGRGKAGPVPCSGIPGPTCQHRGGSDCRNSPAGSSLAALTTRMHRFCQKGQTAVRNGGHYRFQKNSFEQGEAVCHSWGLSVCTSVVSNQAGLPTLPPIFILTSSLSASPESLGTRHFFSHSLGDFQPWFLVTQVVVVLSSKNALEGPM